MDDETVVVRTFRSRLEAEMAQGLLEGEGIRSEITADDIGGQIPGMFPARLAVLREDSERAEQVLDDAGIEGMDAE